MTTQKNSNIYARTNAILIVGGLYLVALLVLGWIFLINSRIPESERIKWENTNDSLRSQVAGLNQMLEHLDTLSILSRKLISLDSTAVNKPELVVGPLTNSEAAKEKFQLLLFSGNYDKGLSKQTKSVQKAYELIFANRARINSLMNNMNATVATVLEQCNQEKQPLNDKINDLNSKLNAFQLVFDNLKNDSGNANEAKAQLATCASDLLSLQKKTQEDTEKLSKALNEIFTSVEQMKKSKNPLKNKAKIDILFLKVGAAKTLVEGM